MENTFTVVDVDGVLLDIHAELEKELNAKGYAFNMDEVKRYDFNKPYDSLLLPDLKTPRSAIFDEFKKITIFENAQADYNAIEQINKMADSKHRFAIYTLSLTSEIQLFKQFLFKKWFKENPYIQFIGKDKDKEPLKDATAVIEDCHINLMNYPISTRCCLINKSYNQEKWNPDYTDVLSRVYRYNNAHEALLSLV